MYEALCFLRVGSLGHILAQFLTGLQSVRWLREPLAEPLTGSWPEVPMGLTTWASPQAASGSSQQGSWIPQSKGSKGEATRGSTQDEATGFYTRIPEATASLPPRATGQTPALLQRQVTPHTGGGGAPGGGDLGAPRKPATLPPWASYFSSVCLRSLPTKWGR